MSDIDVVVIIATSMKRTDLLINRSLFSVYQQQNIQPVAIYVVDDNQDVDSYTTIYQQVRELRYTCFESRFDGDVPQHWFPTYVIKNERTHGRSGSGCWNTAATHAYNQFSGDSSVYLAILDDDDAWEPDYLERCVEAASYETEPVVAAVVSSFYRYEPDQVSLVQVDETNLTQNEFFIGNPGWQGSNTFVQLSCFWQAGGFDEAMSSTHDRDFAIRLLDVTTASQYKVKAIRKPLMKHFVHSRQRVTTCPKKKKQGLDCFYAKYDSRMTPDIRATSQKRAQKLFSYKEQLNIETKASEDKKISLDQFNNVAPVEILIGVVSSSATNIRQQLQSLKGQIEHEPQFAGYCHYLVVTNGSDDEAIEAEILSSEINSIRLQCINTAEQTRAYARFPSQQLFSQEPLDSKSIAYSRTLLQFFCREVAQQKGDDCVVLILDDDLSFESLMVQGNSLSSVRPNFLGKLSELKNNPRADLYISAYSDAPPLPFYSSMRTQLIDVLHSLQQFAGSDLQPRSHTKSDALARLTRQEDYYYDLSSLRYDHLEQPIPWHGVELTSTEPTLELFRSFLKDICHLDKEANISRPLTLDPGEWPLLVGSSCFRRGGIAIFFGSSGITVGRNEQNLGIEASVPDF